MEDNNIILGKRISGKNSVKAALLGFLVSSLFFAIDLIYYLFKKSKGEGATWHLIVFIISCVILGFATLALLFSYSSFKTNKKIINTPLLSYNKLDNTFIFYDVYGNSEKKLNKDDVLRVECNLENNEANIFYLKDGKEKQIFIGFTTIEESVKINDKINELKNNTNDINE